MPLTFGFAQSSLKICVVNKERADLELLRHKSDSQTGDKHLVTDGSCHSNAPLCADRIN
jgi:hypothetical protein